MQSKWFNLKDKAISLRKGGKSIPSIENKLGIPRSTLSGWFQGIELTVAQKKRLHNNWKLGLVAARKNAVKWHNAQKAGRIKVAEEEATSVLNDLNLSNTNILELALSLLYLGEGSKKNHSTLIGNSDPLILKFFLVILVKLYKVPIENIRASLHLRADQNPVQLKAYWSKQLDLPIENFRTISFDKRTEGRPTYPDYKGVCVIQCGRIDIQRKLVFMSRLYCEKIIRKFEDV